MDNYLSYRWPEGVKGDWQPECELPRRKGKRRRFHPLAAAVLVVVLLAGLGLGGWFLTQHFLERWSGEDTTASAPSGEEGGGVKPSLPGVEQGETDPPISVPRAEVGLGVTLEVEAHSGDMLAPQAVYNKVLPSVVSIAALVNENGGYNAGSGVIMREDGYILTNYHVIDGSSSISVMLLADESVYEAKLVGYDAEYDIAVLKIDAAGLTAARFGDSDSLKVGDTAYAIGNPMGYLYGTMTDGIISALTRGVTVGDYDMTLIQTSAALNSGNSGGALINAAGQVVGIAVAKISGQTEGALVEGLAFAIPITDVRPFINRILETGESWRPTIGITCYEALADGIGGIMVVTVEPGTPALAAGLRENDLIIAANGIPVDTLYGLKRVLSEVGVGGTLTCTVIREGVETEVAFSLIDSTDLAQ